MQLSHLILLLPAFMAAAQDDNNNIGEDIGNVGADIASIGGDAVATVSPYLSVTLSLAFPS